MTGTTIKAEVETCDVTNCTEDAVIAFNEFRVKPQGSTQEVDVGRVAFCGPHFHESRRTGRVELDWERILLAATSE